MGDRFSELPIFLDAHALVIEIYKITRKFPQDEYVSIHHRAELVGKQLNGLINYCQKKA